MAQTMQDLREAVLEANLTLVRQGLVTAAFGNASGYLREEQTVVIKPSGVDYRSLKAQDLVATDLKGRILEGHLRPSSDLDTHLALYQSFPQIGGVVHTHSRFATAWAQSGREIPCLGTTHADYFPGSVPITEVLQDEEIEKDYEKNTGHVIVRRFAQLSPESFPAVLVAGHGPFCWGRTPQESAQTAVLLEEIARIAFYTVALNPEVTPISDTLVDKHFLRKHGPGAYYGQR